MRQPAAKQERGAQLLNGRARHHWPPLLATGLGRVLFAGLLQLLTEHGP